MLTGFRFLKKFRPHPWPSSLRLPPFQAHRGSMLEGARENSLEALRSAARLGRRMAEFDVRFSRDGVPVLQHDESLARVHGVTGMIAALTAAELREHGVDLLEDVLRADGVPELLNVEVKSTRLTWSNPGAQEKALADVFRRTGSMERVTVSSFDPMALFSLGLILPEIPLAFLYGHISETRVLSQLALLPLLRVHMLNLDRHLLSELWLTELAAREVPFNVWTVNDPREADFFLRRGAMSIITDQNLFGLR